MYRDDDPTVHDLHTDAGLPAIGIPDDPTDEQQDADAYPPDEPYTRADIDAMYAQYLRLTGGADAAMAEGAAASIDGVFHLIAAPPPNRPAA